MKVWGFSSSTHLDVTLRVTASGDRTELTVPAAAKL